MKKFEVSALGLEEMSLNEITTVEGGIPWKTIWKATKYVAGLVGAWAADKGLDALFSASEEEDIYDATFYGGTIDPAYCYGE